MRKIKEIILISSSPLFTKVAFSQEIEVKKFDPVAKDQAAALKGYVVIARVYKEKLL